MKPTMTILSLMLVAAVASPQAQQKTLKFLAPADVDPSRLVPPPPKDGSDTQKRELAEVRRLIKTRTPERLAQAKWDNEHEDPSAFAAVIGPGFDLSKLPATAKLLEAIQSEQAVANGRAKFFFNRSNPVVAAAAADYPNWTCDTNPRNPADRPMRSYPSGHVTMGYTFAVVLSALIPEKAQAILARAADYGYSREICGDHYHTDIEASQAFGTAIGVLLLNNAALKPQLKAARAELQAARLTM